MKNKKIVIAQQMEVIQTAIGKPNQNEIIEIALSIAYETGALDELSKQIERGKISEARFIKNNTGAVDEEDEEDEAHDQFGGDQSVMDCNLREAGL